MGYSDGAWERAMKIQEVILRALSGENHWFQAAEILGLSVRTMRRYELGWRSGVTRVCSIVVVGRLRQGAYQ